MSTSTYPSYRSSRSAWLGDVPTKWDVLPGRRVFAQRRDPVQDSDEQLSATQRYGVVPQRDFMEREDQKVMLALGGVGNFKHVEKNDFVISLRSFQGGIEHSAFTGCVSPAYTVLRLRSAAEPLYFRYLLKSAPYIAALQSTTDSLRDGKSISYEQFGGISLPLPPLPEQAAIAAFLDRETSKIDALVEEQRRLIELLKEKRQAIISHAVTKGLDPNVRMKDSGVEWLGEVPEHWVIEKFSRYVQIAEGQVDPRREPFASMVLIAPNHIESATGRLLCMETAAEQGAESGKYRCQAGDVIYSKIRPALAKAVLTPVDALCSADMYPMRGRNGLAEQYLLWLLLSSQFTAWSVLEADRVAMPKINREALSDLRLPLPPSTEQVEIYAYLDRETSGLDALLLQAETANALLQERRAALISAAVTGKIDVRESAKEPALADL